MLATCGRQLLSACPCSAYDSLCLWKHLEMTADTTLEHVIMGLLLVVARGWCLLNL